MTALVVFSVIIIGLVLIFCIYTIQYMIDTTEVLDSILGSICVVLIGGMISSGIIYLTLDKTHSTPQVSNVLTKEIIDTVDNYDTIVTYKLEQNNIEKREL